MPFLERNKRPGVYTVKYGIYFALEPHVLDVSMLLVVIVALSFAHRRNTQPAVSSR